MCRVAQCSSGGSAEYLRFRRGVSVKSRLFVNAFDEQIWSFFLPNLEGLNGLSIAAKSVPA